ncbi:cysteine hydrolase family protein [Serratia plymuthica]|jgi:nicotinamidase-related amidase|uniref:cysteine hydrolase family protein n=1 Tax=Serratia plymuthica TaxID=82996 RepID=UPI000935A4BF|nr:cysteine hydrolase family protein [Serratia plymuthica]OJT44344.1 cysteine hydrolase [Serratia plymuthica]
MQQHHHRTALLIIDMQLGMYEGPEPPYEGERVLANINALIGRARDAGCPIFFVRHAGPEGSPIAAGSHFWQLHPRLAIDAAVDRVIDKNRPSCFYHTGLAEQLNEGGITRLAIMGMKTQYCVDTACRQAGELGFQTLLVADAHTCSDTQALSAEAIIRHHNLTLSGPFAQLIQTADVQF